MALPAHAQPQNQDSLQSLTYADLADLGAGAPVVAHLRVRAADRLGEREATTVRAGHTRFEIEAEVVALIRGSGGLPARIRYLVDLPNDSRGRPPRIARRSEFLVMATRVPNRPDELRLVTADAQLPYNAAAAEMLRNIVREASGAEAPPRITGIGRAFSVPGNLPGERETQFFLLTADQRPISLTVLRRPGEQVRWAVALGEIVEEGAAPPQPNTLLWYRLACTLPARLPEEALSESSPDEVQSIQADYRVIQQGLGRCARTRAPRR
ncbi:MAG TPA: hypothetical protein VMG08_05465 [Allosphingosinicella sp.]|nr:hypothetical protein [Allosphingosinicella sp.]